MARKERNRKQRKARYIRVKNLMRMYPDCAYNGDFYCNFIYDPDHPWIWVDFRFFHTQLKRYFAVSMMTCEYAEYCKAETRALDQLSEVAQYPNQNIYDELINAQLRNLISTRPGFEVKDYGSVAVGIWATVNKAFIDEHVIREFIAFFRSLGEPTKPGWSWYDEEIQVDCRKFLRGQAPQS